MNKSKQRFNSRMIIVSKMLIMLIMGALFLVACTNEGEKSRYFTLGLATNNPNGLKNVQGFKDGMTSLGWIEGENVNYIFAGEPVKGDALSTTLQRMVEAKVDLIFTAGTPTGIAAHKATAGTNIPVVFGVIADPIVAGVMDNLIHPGGNMTGVMLSRNQAKRFELLLELVPDVKRVFIPFNPDDAAPTSAIVQIYELASNFGIELVEGLARNNDEVLRLLANIPEDIDAIFMLPDSTVNARVDDLIAAAIKRKLPVSAPSLIQVERGALAAYGIIHHEAGMQAAHIANQILKGADPGNLPVETAEFHLGINLQTAGAIGLEIPFEILQQAEVIIRTEE